MSKSASNNSTAILILDPNNPDSQPEQQHANIKAAIKLYKDGQIDGSQQIYIKGGKRQGKGDQERSLFLKKITDMGWK
jgi:hypothetical protein